MQKVNPLLPKLKLSKFTIISQSFHIKKQPSNVFVGPEICLSLFLKSFLLISGTSLLCLGSAISPVGEAKSVWITVVSMIHNHHNPKQVLKNLVVFGFMDSWVDDVWNNPHLRDVMAYRSTKRIVFFLHCSPAASKGWTTRCCEKPSLQTHLASCSCQRRPKDLGSVLEKMPRETIRSLKTCHQAIENHIMLSPKDPISSKTMEAKKMAPVLHHGLDFDIFWSLIRLIHLYQPIIPPFNPLRAPQTIFRLFGFATPSLLSYPPRPPWEVKSSVGNMGYLLGKQMLALRRFYNLLSKSVQNGTNYGLIGWLKTSGWLVGWRVQTLHDFLRKMGDGHTSCMEAWCSPLHPFALSALLPQLPLSLDLVKGKSSKANAMDLPFPIHPGDWVECWVVATSQCHSQHGGSMYGQMCKWSKQLRRSTEVSLSFGLRDGDLHPHQHQQTDRVLVSCLIKVMKIFTTHVAPKRGKPGKPFKCKTVKKHIEGFRQSSSLWSASVAFGSFGASELLCTAGMSKEKCLSFSHIPIKNAPCQVNTPSIRIEFLSTWRFTKKSTVSPLWGQTASQLWLAPAPPCAEPPRPLRPPAEELISHVCKVYSRILMAFFHNADSIIESTSLHYTKMK